MFGVLCVYLLIGMAFAFAYGIDLGGRRRHLLRPDQGGTQADFLYFSFVTMTTTGFGDLTASPTTRQGGGGDRGADRADLPGHRGRADHLQPGRPRARPGERAGGPRGRRRRRRGDGARSSARGSRTGWRRSRPSPPAWPRWRRSPSPRRPVLVAERDGEIVGWAKVGSLYRRSRLLRDGRGGDALRRARMSAARASALALMRALAEAAERAGFHKLVGKIMTFNTASIELVRALRLAPGRRRPAPRSPRR